MPLLFLIRHGENDYTHKGKLAGRLPGVHLNARGREQAAALAETLGVLPLKAVYASPLERAIETAQPLAEARRLEVTVLPELLEIDVGRWQGRTLKSLRRTKAWRMVQEAPSRAGFPEGETFHQAQARVVAALEDILARHRPKDALAVFFHADPIKLAVAHYIGLPLDFFQRLHVETGSVTALAVGERGVRLLWLNRVPPFSVASLSRKRGARPK
ncbi:MAG: phosphoglycerate mutase [Anaerolineae bacterium]|nr:MAG: phosphoglycerate mutase [Anaerolineae bacterium]